MLGCAITRARGAERISSLARSHRALEVSSKRIAQYREHRPKAHHRDFRNAIAESSSVISEPHSDGDEDVDDGHDGCAKCPAHERETREHRDASGDDGTLRVRRGRAGQGGRLGDGWRARKGVPVHARRMRDDLSVLRFACVRARRGGANGKGHGPREHGGARRKVRYDERRAQRNVGYYFVLMSYFT